MKNNNTDRRTDFLRKCIVFKTIGFRDQFIKNLEKLEEFKKNKKRFNKFVYPKWIKCAEVRV